MQPFLQLVANDLLNRYGSNISDITLVFPNRRAGLFFSKYLAENLTNPIWTPAIITLGDLMQRIAKLAIEDSIALVAKLYRIYVSSTGSEKSFESFYYWGEVMLADFNELDKYLIDPKQLFGNIKDLKQIDKQFSGFTEEQYEALREYLGVMENTEISDIKQGYINIWDKLFDIYTLFWHELEQEGVAYEGMLYRKAAMLLNDSYAIGNLPSPIAFIGFNALNQCEKLLFEKCKSLSKALFYWDYDPIFMNQKENLAGLFMQENLRLFPNALSSNLLESSVQTPKNIKIISAPSAVSQSKLLPTLLSQVQQEGGDLDITTAIILPQENILIPTLQAIPPHVESLNITIGYPLKETPAYSLIEFLSRLQINARNHTEDNEQFYHKDVVDILNHPYIQLCEPEKSNEILQNILKSNRLYPLSKELVGPSLFNLIFKAVADPALLGHYMLAVTNDIAKQLAEKAQNSEDSQLQIELEFLFTLHRSLIRLNDMLANLKVSIAPKLFISLLRKVFNQERVSFSGEPLSGLQVIGFLETRALDFENIIILSFNDDIIPGKNRQISFIAPSLRFAFDLPTVQHRDAMYAYSFYRLMHRAQNVFLVYSNRTEGLSSGEMSRFALQLNLVPSYNQPETIDVGYKIELTPKHPLLIPKTEEVMETLISNLRKKNGQTTLSPSGLTAFLICPMRFYFRYVVGLADEKEITEEVGAIEFGNILHGTMQSLYNEPNGKVIQKNEIDLLIKQEDLIERKLHHIFCNEFLKGVQMPISEFSGRNQLAYNTLLYTIKKMLKVDRDRAPFTLIGHEKEVSITLPVNFSKHTSEVCLQGTADRIEQNNGAIWLIDYKTGNPQYKGVFSEVSNLFDSKSVMNHKEVFQTFCYSLALSESYKEQAIVPMLWFVKKVQSVNDLYIRKTEGKERIPVTDFRNLKEEFTTGLYGLLRSILSVDEPFIQTEDITRCKFCPYGAICDRE